MRKTLLLSMLVLAITSLHAQYFQNFDSYTFGDYIGVQDASWTTWSGTTGNTEDAKVDTNQAFSGNNSIYFMSTSSNGGPQDAVLDFGGAYNTGNFVFSQMMYVPANKGGYFNFQAESTIGTTWALNVYLINDGNMYVDDAKTVHVTTQFPVAQWFEFKVEINLNTNTWELFIDNVSKGTWQNDVNKVASVDYFPLCSSNLGGNNQAEFWLDDVAFTHTPYTLPALNAGVSSVGFKKVALAGGTNEPKIQIRNLGTTAITSIDLDITYNGNTVQKSLTGLNIASLDFYDVLITPGVLVDASANTMTATITGVNGSTGDDDNTDDSKVYTFTPIIPAAGKMVIVEEATGTWCGWCPRGAVALEFLAQDYHGFAQGIAVHNGDPMVDATYDTGIGTLINGYPSAVVDRGSDLNPAAIWSDVNANLLVAPTALMVNGAKFNPSGQLEVSITASFQDVANNNWKMACVLIEDSVTGTSSGYAQANYYAGGSSGDLIMPDGTNWANLPSTVPASQMVYNHVARVISPSFEGFDGLPASISNGDQVTINFIFNINSDWDTSKIHIVGMLMKPDGTVDNGSSTTIPEAVSNGFVPGIGVGIAEYLPGPDMNLYPNPVKEEMIIELEENYNEVYVEIHSQLGQVVHQESIANPGTDIKLTLNAKPGIYFVKISSKEGALKTFKVVKI